MIKQKFELNQKVYVVLSNVIKEMWVMGASYMRKDDSVVTIIYSIAEYPANTSEVPTRTATEYQDLLFATADDLLVHLRKGLKDA